MKNIHLSFVTYITGMCILSSGLFFLTCIPISIVYEDHQSITFLISFIIAGTIGILAMAFSYKSRDTKANKSDSFLIVSLVWIMVSIIGALPYWISDKIPVFIDALFESTSGFTTTGSSILIDIEGLPKSLLFWRALTHWIGGMGIIMLMVAVFPFFKVGGNQLMVAEGSLFGVDKIKPRIINVAKRLWLIYIVFTASETILLKIAGMSWFDAVCHSFATIATGGFSTQNASLIHDSATIQYIVILFMFLSGINFALHYYGFKIKIGDVWKNEELRLYTLLTVFISAIIAVQLNLHGDKDIFTSIRESLFQVVSIITCTGFASADYELWPSFAKFMLFLTMFLGACTGSTGGGIKIARYVLLIKSFNLSLKKINFPNTVSVIKFNNKLIEEPIIQNTFSFVVIYILTIFIGTMALTATGVDVITAGSSIVTTLGGIGPGFGLVGPAENFSSIPDLAKFYLCFNMILGRLEILPFLMFFYIPFSKF